MSQFGSPPKGAQIRFDLAAALRLDRQEGCYKGVANHLSVAASADSNMSAINARWAYLSRMRAGDLIAMDAGDLATNARPDAPDPSPCSILSALHRRLQLARVALYVLPLYVMTLFAHFTEMKWLLDAKEPVYGA
ncbi:hypothetical protein ACMU_09895 [Actibacterium mucosum KCTC 23349]|uniref:Class II aldolase/adducin N-terminal domain-containing protein n=1 Tax=Actibacterium mucosum KCTC 23349 TaxID=1454373 RepID=A0A037ZMM0_9RHOB|nr:class II aldolase/adducin family protein [Actibacterium mucosum]KAJ56061.1 hypothetical protein ACMU_09895 [Actibacterium mucosum KCTC 23349]